MKATYGSGRGCHENAVPGPRHVVTLLAFRRRRVGAPSLPPIRVRKPTRMQLTHRPSARARGLEIRWEAMGASQRRARARGNRARCLRRGTKEIDGRVRGHPLDGDAEGTEERDFAGPSRQRPEWGPAGSRTQRQLPASTQLEASIAAERHARNAAGAPAHSPGQAAIASGGTSSPNIST